MQNLEKRARKRLHVSNIPYELKKSDLIDLFSSVGPVLDCELINDKTTGKFKGSAKIEYPDNYTVKAALRNLNRYEIKGRFLKLNFANSDKFPTDKSEIINEDEFSDPEEFELKNLDKDIGEVIHGLQPNQKLFLLEELKQLYETNEEEFRNILRQDEKIIQIVLSLQRDLKLDRSNQSMFEEEAVRNQGTYGMMNRSLPKLGAQGHQIPSNIGPYAKRIQPMNKNVNMQRRMMGINKPGYSPGGMQNPPRLHQSYMNIEEQGGSMEMMGMQSMRRPGGQQQFFQDSEQRQFNPNMNQQNVKGKMFYNSNNRMF